MKRLLGLGFWISALYFVLYTKIPTRLREYPSRAVCACRDGYFTHRGDFLLRTAHYPLLIFPIEIQKELRYCLSSFCF